MQSASPTTNNTHGAPACCKPPAVGRATEQRALEKAGFGRESVVRGSLFRVGGWHDLVLFGLLRGDLEQSG